VWFPFLLEKLIDVLFFFVLLDYVKSTCDDPCHLGNDVRLLLSWVVDGMLYL
jgi:hypothetical protein